MNVLSLCDGMSCGQIALIELGVKYDKYYASEIDKHAIKQTQLNFPDTIQLGSIEGWKDWDIDWASIDLVLAGTPCTGFSFAGKGLAFNDPQSRLFFVFVDIYNHIKALNPNVLFLLENVKMKKAYLRIISEMVGVFPVFINSALVSAQNRGRYYWSNIKTKPIGLFGEVHTDIPLPADRGILLRDILEDEVDEKYYLSETMIKTLSSHPKGYGTFAPFDLESGNKSRCIRACCYKMATIDTYIRINTKGNPERNQQKASYLTGAGGHGTGNRSDMDLIYINQSGRTSNKKQNNLIIQLNLSKKSNGTQPQQQDRVYSPDGKCPALLAGLGGRNNAFVKDRIRRLTPTECSRLQTIPAWYKWECSDTQAYKMCGNGWTVEVIMHILSFLPARFFIDSEINS
jgi:DNA (cytosine-5)-methyltransferase 3A